MRIEPNQISHRLAAMLLKVGRGDLTRTGFEVHEDALERSKRHESDPDRALFHALFDKGAPHNAPGLIGGVKAWAQDVSYVHFMLTVIVVLVAAQSARCQPSQNLVVRGQNGSTTQFTRAAGLLDFKCDGTTVICSWNSTTSTWTITAAGGGGGSPGGASCDVQYNNSGAFGGASDWCFDAATGLVSFTPTLSGALPNVSYSADNSQLTLDGTATTVLGFNTIVGKDIGLILNEPFAAANLNMTAYGQRVSAELDSADSIQFVLGQSLGVNINNGTARQSIGSQAFSLIFGGDVTQSNNGIYIGALNFSGAPITGYEAGVEVFVGPGQGDSGAAGGIDGYRANDAGGKDDGFGHPVYQFHAQGAGNWSFAGEGDGFIDGSWSVGSLIIAGHACTLVAGVPHCP